MAKMQCANDKATAQPWLLNFETVKKNWFEGRTLRGLLRAKH
jgi:hypothetical protein